MILVVTEAILLRTSNSNHKTEVNRRKVSKRCTDFLFTKIWGKTLLVAIMGKRKRICRLLLEFLVHSIEDGLSLSLLELE